VRKVTRRPPSVELPEEHPADATSPIEAAIEAESYDRYRAALSKLSERDRKMVVARIEVQWTLNEIAQRFGLQTVDAARMAVLRAVRRLRGQMGQDS
jgi:DNA-directed RNA polymerase specialized sigma24 family protein